MFIYELSSFHEKQHNELNAQKIQYRVSQTRAQKSFMANLCITGL